MGPRTIDRAGLLALHRISLSRMAVGSTRGIECASTATDGLRTAAARTKQKSSEALNVNPREVERLIIEDDTVAEAAVVGVRESTGASALQAFLVPTNDAFIDESAIRDIHRQLLTRLSAFKVPHRFAIVERLPRTATGKVLRGALRAESPAKPIWELPLIDPESDAEAQLDNRPASNVQMVVGNSGEITLNERLAVLRRERHRLVRGRGLYRDRENVGRARSAVGRSGSRLLGAGL